MDTNQRPAQSRLTVTVEGWAPSGSPRDQRISSGSTSFARYSCPLRQRNAELVNSADAFDRRLDLNFG
jgi:hypothetical protein